MKTTAFMYLTAFDTKKKRGGVLSFQPGIHPKHVLLSSHWARNCLAPRGSQPHFYECSSLFLDHHVYGHIFNDRQHSFFLSLHYNLLYSVTACKIPVFPLFFPISVCVSSCTCLCVCLHVWVRENMGALCVRVRIYVCASVCVWVWQWRLLLIPLL